MLKSASIMVLSLFVTSVSVAEFKAGYVNVQKAIQSTKEGKSAKKTLEKEFNKKKNSLKKKEESLKKKAQNFEKKKMVLSDKVRATKQRELQEEMMKFQEELRKGQRAMAEKEVEITKPILKKMEKVIDKIAKEKGLSMVFEQGQNGVVWAKQELDITDEVVKKYNKK